MELSRESMRKLMRYAARRHDAQAVRIMMIRLASPSPLAPVPIRVQTPRV